MHKRIWIARGGQQTDLPTKSVRLPSKYKPTLTNTTIFFWTENNTENWIFLYLLILKEMLHSTTTITNNVNDFFNIFFADSVAVFSFNIQQC